MRRSFSLVRAVLPALVLAALAACTPTAAAPPHELRIALSVDPASLSPLLAFSQNQIAYDQLFCQTLVGLSADNRVVPILAARVPSRANGDVSPDGTRITYHLRRDVRFADGVPFTSADVAFTYGAIFDPRNNAASVDAYRRIASLTTPDPYTVVVRLRSPWNAAVNVLFAQADFAYGILPKHAFAGTKVSDTPWDHAPFGTGPFRVAEWRRGDRILLVANRYFRPVPKLARIELRVITNSNSAFVALRTHEVDVATLNPSDVGEAATVERVRVVRVAENGLGAVYLQTARAPTDDVHVRRAIAFAIDAAALRKSWRNAYPDAAGFLPAPVVRWSPLPLAPYRHDLAAAAHELDAAGWRLRDGVRVKDGQPLALLYAVDAEDPVEPPIAVLAEAALTQLGIRTTIKSYPASLFNAPSGPLRTGSFALVFAQFIGGSDPEQSINVLCAQARNGGESYSRYCSPRFERLFADQMRAPSEAQRRRDFDAMRVLVRDDLPMIPLYDEIYLEGLDTRVTGYAKNMLRYPVAPETWDTR